MYEPYKEQKAFYFLQQLINYSITTCMITIYLFKKLTDFNQLVAVKS